MVRWLRKGFCPAAVPEREGMRTRLSLLQREKAKKLMSKFLIRSAPGPFGLRDRVATAVEAEGS